MWNGVSIFEPTWKDVEIIVKKSGEQFPNVSRDERLLWVGQSNGKFAPLAYIPKKMWNVLYIIAIWISFTLLMGHKAGKNVKTEIELFLIIFFISFLMFSIMVILIYRLWFYNWRRDIYLVTDKFIHFYISSGVQMFPWTGYYYDINLRRIVINRNKSNTFSIPLFCLNTVEVRKLPFAEVGNIYFPGWADDRRLRVVTKELFLCDEKMLNRSNIIYNNNTMIRIGPRQDLRPSAMYSIPQVSRVGDLIASLMYAARDEHRGVQLQSGCSASGRER